MFRNSISFKEGLVIGISTGMMEDFIIQSIFA